MLPRTLQVAALAVAVSGWAPAAQSSPEPPFEVVYRAPPGERVEFAYVEGTAPLVLGIFSARGQLATWPAAQFEAHGADLPQLDPGERFTVNRPRSMFAVQAISYACVNGTGLSGLARATTLRFVRPFPPPPPVFQPPLGSAPIPDPLRPVDGACVVHLSDDGLLALFVRTHLERSQPTEVAIFRRSDPADTTFERTGDYVNASQGEVQTSLGGRWIAHREGPRVRLLDPTGTQRSRLPVGQGFRLAPDGLRLATWDRGSVRVIDLDPQSGVPVGRPAVIPTASPAHAVSFLGSRVLVRERTRVSLVQLPGEEVLWSRETTLGGYTSDALVESLPGHVLVALGRVNVQRPPARREGAFVAGSARVFVEVFEVASDRRLASTDYSITRWDHGSPRLHFVPSPTRLLVENSHSVLLSAPLP